MPIFSMQIFNFTGHNLTELISFTGHNLTELFGDTGNRRQTCLREMILVVTLLHNIIAVYFVFKKRCS